MKHSKVYSKKMQKLFRSLKRRYPKPEKFVYDEPLDALIYALISEKISQKEAQVAIKKFPEYFVDHNDLRVSRPEEITEMLGEDSAVTKEIATKLKAALRTVFEKYNTVSLLDTKKIGKRQVREILGKINHASPFVIDYCMLAAFGGHAIPLTEKMIDFLKAEQLVHPEADYQQIEGFLTRLIAAKNGYDFYMLLRLESEAAKKRDKKTKTLGKKGKKIKTEKTKGSRAKKRKK